MVSEKFGIVVSSICHFLLYSSYSIRFAAIKKYSCHCKLDIPALNLSDIFRLSKKLVLADYSQLFNSIDSLSYRKSSLILFAFRAC